MNCCTRCIQSCCVASMITNPQATSKQPSNTVSKVDGVTTLSASGSVINELEVDMTHFSKPTELLGIGGFGLVRKAKKLTGPDAGKEYAMKSTSKASTLARSTGLQAVMTELKVLIMLRGKSSAQTYTNTISNTNTNTISNTSTHTPALVTHEGDGSEYICQLHYAFQDQTHLYFVLDYAIGGDMRYNMRRCSYFRFSEVLVQIFMKQVFYALQYCHDNSILHRDIKPENILLHASGKVSLSDFGVAKLLPDIEACRSTSGTHGYMAPEVYTKEHTHGTAFDWFAAGVTTFELLTGRRPFEACKIQQYHTRVAALSSSDDGVMHQQLHHTPSDGDGVCAGLCGVGSSLQGEGNAQGYGYGQGEDELEVEDLRAMYGVSNMCMDFLIKILCPNPQRRIGAKGNFKSLITHPFLSSVSLNPYPQHVIKQMLPHLESIGRLGGGLVKAPPAVSKVNLSSGDVQGQVRAHLQGAGVISDESQELFKHFEYNLRYEAIDQRAPCLPNQSYAPPSPSPSPSVPTLTPTKRGVKGGGVSGACVVPPVTPCSPPFSPTPSPPYGEKKMRGDRDGVCGGGAGAVGWGWGIMGAGGSEKGGARGNVGVKGRGVEKYVEVKREDGGMRGGEGEEMKECNMV